MKYSALIIAAATVAIGFATPVSAKPRQVRPAPQNQYDQFVVPNANTTCVYRGTRLAGCDPDPNIRTMIERSNGNHYGPA